MFLRPRDAFALAVLLAWTLLLVFCSQAEASYAGEVTPEEMTVTAYCLQGTTYSGEQVRHGAIAAHQTVPLYTRYYIPEYGSATVLDRGLLGVKQLDVWVFSCRFALHTWERRSLTVWRFL